MITSITGIFRLSMVGDFGDEVLEDLALNNLEVALKSGDVEISQTHCDDLMVSKLSVEDEYSESCLKNDLLEYYKNVNTQDVNSIHMVILNNIRYQVFKINSTIHMINGLTNELEFTIPSEKFINFLESKDDCYSTYKRINKFL